MHTNAAGRRVALLRAYDKQTGSPMSYSIDGRQFIVISVSGNDGAELLASALP